MIWYEEEVTRVEKEFAALEYTPETIFYGSSSFTLWKTLREDFEDLKPVNLGFGGSTLAACVWFFERIFRPIESAKNIVLYAGDNDLGDGRIPEEVLLSYRQLVNLIRARYGDIPIYYISIKPSLQRWHIIDRIKQTNAMICEEIGQDANQHYIDIFSNMLTPQTLPDNAFFETDGLHLSMKGYEMWKEKILEKVLIKI